MYSDPLQLGEAGKRKALGMRRAEGSLDGILDDKVCCRFGTELWSRHLEPLSAWSNEGPCAARQPPFCPRVQRPQPHAAATEVHAMGRSRCWGFSRLCRRSRKRMNAGHKTSVDGAGSL
jgi:hypothetical protein